MSFSEKLGKFAKASVNLTGKALSGLIQLAAGAAQSQQSVLHDYEKKLDRMEQSRPDMTAEQRAKIQQAREKIQERKTAVYGVTQGDQSVVTSDGKIGGKTFAQWDSMWQCIGRLETADLSAYNHCVGLYKHTVGGKIKYIGRAIELNNGGFRKRLSDYRRDSDSARKHQSGQTIHENLDKNVTYVLVVGDDEEAVQVTKVLERVFIQHYVLEWNFMLKKQQ